MSKWEDVNIDKLDREINNLFDAPLTEAEIRRDKRGKIWHDNNIERAREISRNCMRRTRAKKRKEKDQNANKIYPQKGSTTVLPNGPRYRNKY